jgi:phosphoribosyl-ATP pyrophosphohydrolase/phosphoribosyl-AMP cyclohydrolase
MTLDLDALDFSKGGGVVTVVTQDARTGAVLMVAQADRDALDRTMASGEMHYRSRSRGPWHKGETSGNTQRVVSLRADCDGDAVLALVEPAGPACHTGTLTCFGDATARAPLQALDQTILERSLAHEPLSYTRRLLDDRNFRLKKLGEECAELITACADGERERAVSEAADLYYHMMVALRALDAGLADVERVLGDRSAWSTGGGSK